MREITFICLVILMTSCNSSNQNNAAHTNSTDSKTTVGNESKDEKNVVYPWVDNLNIRDQPNAQGKVITTVNIDDELKLTESTSEKMETIVLRGVAYQDYWYKIQTSDGKEGWIFGGAVKQKNEQKGNAILTKEKFNFPYFGEFDLSEWKAMQVDHYGGGDVEGTVFPYQKENQILEITESNMGEYGYSYTQKLSDTKRNVLKERIFKYGTSEATDGKYTLSEQVIDYTQSVPTKYSRAQELDVSHFFLKPKPVMALGNWKTETLNDSKNTDSSINMRTLFEWSPLSIFENTVLGITNSEKQNLVQKGNAATWKISEESNSKLVLQSIEVDNDIVKLFFLKNNKNADGILAVETPNGPTSKIELWKYLSKTNSLEKHAPLKKYSANDFVSKADALPSTFQPQLNYQFIDDNTIEVSLYTWMVKEFENRKIINKILLKWDGEEFVEHIKKIKG